MLRNTATNCRRHSAVTAQPWVEDRPARAEYINTPVNDQRAITARGLVAGNFYESPTNPSK